MISTYRSTTITTIIKNNEHETLKKTLDNPKVSQKDCPKIPDKSPCQTHVEDNATPPKPMEAVSDRVLQDCCAEIKKMKKECMCNGIQQTFDKAQQKQGADAAAKKKMFSKVESLPKQCKLEVKDCHLVAPKVM
ncbi:hypothetical protein QVD17_15494 [Tagetes erecta]|uniref:Bifunctional inhibitor/plant lipid transfer protein/seed storage helical domain-containing protein n=1 Tax=Tagetes erecta TaxID=13708 RepID=A0AAD8NZQ3_TARER|nr:hypothetical protein QVD17_15494 [Tagetes erecta]